MQRQGKLLKVLSAACVHELRLFFTALQFFTRLPIPRWVGFDDDWLNHAARYFPLVGLIVGVITAAAYAVCALIFPSLVAAILSTICGIYLTGAFHEDGFADVCDGFGGGMTAERVIEIMKDSRVGAYGAIGIGLLVLLKCVSLSYLETPSAVAALVLAHPFSRLAAVSLIWRLDYAKAEGKAKPLAQQMTNVEYLIALISVCLPASCIIYFGYLPWQLVLVGILAVIGVTTWLARLFVRCIGGYTGDCLGAVQQMSEVVFYLAALAYANKYLHVNAVI